MTRFNTQLKVFHSSTVEGIFLETALMLQALELSDEFNTSSPKQNKINIQINTDSKTVSISANLPITYMQTQEGKATITAAEYLITPPAYPNGIFIQPEMK